MEIVEVVSIIAEKLKKKRDALEWLNSSSSKYKGRRTSDNEHKEVEMF